MKAYQARIALNLYLKDNQLHNTSNLDLLFMTSSIQIAHSA